MTTDEQAPVRCAKCNGVGLVLVRTGNAYEAFDQGDYDVVDCDCGAVPAPEETVETTEHLCLSCG